MTNNELCKKAIAYYGESAQKIKACEELGELQQAVLRELNGRGDSANLTEEMADVLIMIYQLQMIYGISDEDVSCKIKFKLDRLKSRMEEHHEETT